MDEAGFVTRVEDALVRRVPRLDVRKVTNVSRLAGGLSFETYFVDVETAAGPGRVVLRREPRGGPLAPYDVGFEAALFAALHPTPVPVPEVYHLETDPEVLDRPFVVSQCVPGRAQVHSSPRFADPEARTRTLSTFVEMLARIHTVSVAGLPAGPGGVGTGAADEVRLWRRRFADVELSPRPIVRHVLDVLEEHAPTDTPMVLVHGDYRLSNLLMDGGTISGVLDWERSFVGDPMADIAFTLNKTLAGWCAVTGEAAEQYTRLTGFEIDTRRLAFWQLLELVKAIFVGMASAASLARGTSSDLRLLSVASVSTGIEPAIVHLTQALVAGGKGLPA